MKISISSTVKNADLSGVLSAAGLSDFSRPITAAEIDRIGRTRLSPNFILRDFLFCASSAARGFSNFPENPDQVIRAGKAVCEKLLEPILAEFGRFAITYGYQSRESIDLDLAKTSKAFHRHCSSPHHWDRGTFGEAIYARVDILPYCVEDGQVAKTAFGQWVMHQLDVDLCMSWKRSNVFCLTIGPVSRRCWVEWGRPAMGEKKQEVMMGADYWQNIYPLLPMTSRPKFAPSATNGSMRWGAQRG